VSQREENGGSTSFFGRTKRNSVRRIVVYYDPQLREIVYYESIKREINKDKTYI
jgi:hypothetical protein